MHPFSWMYYAQQKTLTLLKIPVMKALKYSLNYLLNRNGGLKHLKIQV